MDEYATVNGRPLCKRIDVKTHPVYLYRSGAQNRLLIGLPKRHAADWEELLSALGCFPVPQRNGNLLVFWVARTHDAFTELGELHTDMLIEVFENLERGLRFGGLTDRLT